MRFIMKHMSKKMLSVILALMVLLSAVSVAFSAIADAVNAPYVVTMGKPAIAMQTGYTLDLNEINVEFGTEVIPGSELIWDAVPHGSILFDAEAKTLTVFKAGSFTLTAAKATDLAHPRTINVFATGEKVNEVPIYEKVFKGTDLSGGDFTEDSGWQIIKTGTNAASYANNAVSFANDSTSGYMVLKPSSAGGQIVSNFSDVIMEATVYSTNKATVMANSTNPLMFGPIARLTYENNTVSATPKTNVTALYRWTGTRVTSTALNYNINGVANSSVTVVSGQKITNAAYSKFKIEVLGDTLKNYWDIGSTGTYTEVNQLALTTEQQGKLEETEGVCGTIGFYFDKNAWIGVSSVKVSVGFTDSELEKIGNACTKNNFYMVNPEKPAIPVTAGKTINLTEALVEFADGEILTGDKIDWIMGDNSLLYNAELNSVSVFKAGIFEITATKKSGSAHSQKIYIFASNLEATDFEVYSHTFTADDLDENGAFKADGEWSAWINSTTNKWGYTYGGIAPLLWNGTEHWLGDGQYGTIYLNPESDNGKLIGTFKDVTLDATVYVTNQHNADGGYLGPIVRLNLGDDAVWESSDSQITALYRKPGGLYPATSQKKNTAVKFKVAGTEGTEAQQDFAMAINGESTIRVSAVGDAVSTAIDVGSGFETPVAATLTDAQKASVTNIKAGTIGFEFSFNIRTVIRSVKAYISFTAEEIAKAKTLYIESPYHVVSANKPVIPANVNARTVLDNFVVEMSDGSFRLAKDVLWENTNGAVKVDTHNNSIYVYTDDFFTIKAKLNDADAGREIYVITPNKDGIYELYSHTFSAADLDDNGAFKADGEWSAWINSAANKWGYTSHDGIAPLLWNGTEHWLGDNQYGTIYLNPESEAGKFIGQFSDITVEARVKPTLRYNHGSTGSVGPVARLDLGADNAWAAADSQIMAAYKIPGGLSPNNPALYPTVVNIRIDNKSLAEGLKQTYPLKEAEFDLIKLKVVGNTVETFADVTGKGYVKIEGIELTDAQQIAMDATVGKTGRTIGFRWDETTRTVLNKITAYVEFSEAELAKIQILSDFPAIYNLTQDYPALPINQGNKVALADILVQLPDGSYITGDHLEWICSYQGSNFFIDNTEKAIYAYGEGRYDVTIKNPVDNSEVMMVHIIVSGDGTYRLFSHTFTKSDAEALVATGKSDKWIASFHSMKNVKQSGLPEINSTTSMANEWTNTVSALSLGTSLFFDETKGISLYTNQNMLITLNPEYTEAKIIAKFKNYNIDFTSSARDKNSNNSPWSQTGVVGALGRVDFGEDGILSFTNGTYMPNKAAVYEHNRLGAKVGVITNLSTINNLALPGDQYNWTVQNGSDYITLDNIAKTIVASKPGIYNIKGTAEGQNDVTVSLIVPHEDYLDHMLAGVFKVDSKSPAVSVITTKGDNGGVNKYTGNNAISVPYNSSFKYNVPDTYNYRVTLDGDNIALYVAPNGTSSYAELYNSATDATLTNKHREYITASNQKTGTIALYSDEASRAWFKSVSVSLNFDILPNQTSLGECFEEDSRLIYLQVGQALDLTQVNFEAGVKYYNGANITFSNVPADLTVVPGVSITPTKEGVYTLNATANDGTNFTVMIAVSAAGSLFNNGNYKFTSKEGIITGYSRIDATQPYSEYVLFPSELDGEHIYEIDSALAVGNPNNTQLVEVEIEKYIEKIGSGAFIGATKLQKVTIPNTVEEIGASAFSGATALTNVFIPGSVSQIGDYAFQNCTAEVVISNPDAVIGKDVFTAGAKLYGFEGSTAQEYAANNEGVSFEVLTGTAKTQAENSYNEWVKFEADRYTKVNTTVEWDLHVTLINGISQYSITGFRFTERSAGKFVVPAKVEITENGVKKTVSVYPGENAFGNKSDSRAIYAVELEEGTTSVGFWAFENCYNLRDVKLPESLTSIAQRAFQYCTSLETIDIPNSVVTIGKYAFDYCTNLKEVNINPEKSRLQAIGMNAARLSEQPGRFLYNTKVEKFVLPVTVDRITNAVTNFSSIKEIWIYNKDLQFLDYSAGVPTQPYYFAMNTVIHGVPGSTAEAIVRADEALKDDPDPEKRKYYRALKFVGDIEDFYTTQADVLDGEGIFTGKFVQYEVIDEENSKELESPYYVITGFVGKGGKVIMPAYLDIGDAKNVPIYSISADGFQFEGNPTNGIHRIINLEISEGIAAIEDEAFNDTKYLKSIKLPSTLRYIGAKAFNGSGITGRLEIPKNVTEIGQAAFRGTDNLTEIVILNPNLVFGRGIFDPDIVIYGIKGSTAEEYATKNNHTFVEIEAPSASTVSDFTDNGNYKFTVTDGYVTGYERLDSSKPYSLKVTIPATINGVSVKGIAEGTFEMGAEATSVFAVEIQDGITDIAKNAFKGLSKLTYVTFPNTLKTIGEAAFEGTALAGEYTLPESLEKIEKDAFKNLKYITAITILSRNVVIEATSFPRNNPNIVIYGYTGSTAEEWAKNFKIKFEYLDGGPQEKDEETDYTEDPSDADEDDDGENEVVRIIKQSNLALVIVIAVAMLLLAILLAAAVIVIVIIKKKIDEEEEALA